MKIKWRKKSIWLWLSVSFLSDWGCLSSFPAPLYPHFATSNRFTPDHVIFPFSHRENSHLLKLNLFAFWIWLWLFSTAPPPPHTHHQSPPSAPQMLLCLWKPPDTCTSFFASCCMSTKQKQTENESWECFYFVVMFWFKRLFCIFLFSLSLKNKNIS